MRFINERLFQLTVLILALGHASCLFAKPVNLYEQPSADSKVVGTVESSSSLVPIFTSKAGDWMKIGDPKNGNTGWIKVNEMTSTVPGISSTGFSMSEHTVDTKAGPKTYRTIQFTQPEVLSPEQTAAMLKQFEVHRAEIQKYSQQVMQSISQNLNDFYQSNQTMFDKTIIPIFMPIIIAPDQKQPTVKSINVHIPVKQSVVPPAVNNDSNPQ